MRRHIGTHFEDVLRADGRLDESTTLAIKRVLAYQLSEVMTKAKVSQAELARRWEQVARSSSDYWTRTTLQ